MASPVLASCEDRHRSKLGMYCQRPSERPRLLKHVLVSSASNIPDDNQFKSRPVKKKLCSTGSPAREGVVKLKRNKKGDCQSDTVRLLLEQEFMKRLIVLEDAPEDVKFPVLRASHPGGRVFRTQQLGEIKKKNSHQRHPFDLKNPNGPAPKYSCYYDKHLRNFFEKPGIRKKLIEQGIITDEFYIREPYKAFKEYIRNMKLPYGTNPIPSPSPTPRETTKIELRDEFSEASVKEYLKEKFNVNPALVDEIYSGRRKGSVIPLSVAPNGAEEKNDSNSNTLPVIRCNTPQKLTAKERELQESLHNCRVDVVLARRQLLALEKKSNVIEQRIRKEKRLTDNKKQMELGRCEARLKKMITTFDRKKNSIFKRLTEIEQDKLKKQEEKDIEVDKLKKKFAAIFIKHSIAERNVKKKRQELEEAARNRNSAWLQKQRGEREEKLRESNLKNRNTQMSGLARIASEKAARVGKLQLKLESYDANLETLEREKRQMEERLHKLQKEHKKLNKNL
ncbi:hypothetical protein ACHWQZ_G018097 [Mnemiopsis leidyi]